MCDRKIQRRIRMYFMLLFCISFFSIPINSEGGEKKSPSRTQQLCAAAHAFIEDDLFEIAIARYEAILKDEQLLKDAADVSCARTGLVEAKKKLLLERCTTADKILKEKRIVEAERIYKSLLDDKASSASIACARAGLLEVAKRYVARGDARREKDLDAAEKAYDSATKASEECTEAYNKLQDVQHEKKIRHLTTLVEWGSEEEAKKQLLTYLESDPGIGIKSNEFSYITYPRYPLWNELRKARVNTLIPFLRSLPRTLWKMPLTEAIILGVIIGLLGRKYWWGTPTLNIGEFTTSDTKKERGDAFAVELGHQLMDFNSASHIKCRLLMVSAPISPITVNLSTELPSLTGGWKTLLQFLPRLLERRSLVVKGLLHVKEDTADGLTIEIHSGNRILAKHTLWTKDFGDYTDEVNGLAACAAVWILFTLRTNPAQLFAKLNASTRTILGRPLDILGTTGWEAYAWFTLGNKWFQERKPKIAEAAYLKALNRDPKFLAGRVNLAGVYHRLADIENEYGVPEEVEHYLTCAFEQSEIINASIRNGWFDSDDPATTYTGLFRRIAICSDQENIKEAKKAADDLVMQMRKNLIRTWLNDNLAHYLEWRLPVAECIRLGLSLDPDKPPAEDASDDLERLRKILEERMDFYSLYNLACTYALFAARAHETDPDHGTYMPHCLSLLKRCFEISASMKTLGPSSEAELAVRIERAKNDATFKPLKECEPFSTKFTEILAKYPTPDSAETPLPHETADQFRPESQTS